MASFSSNTEVGARSRVFFRVTGKQSVERLEPLFHELSTDPNSPFQFEPVATHADYLLVDEETRRLLAQQDSLKPFVVWETTCEKTLRGLHQGAMIRNKLHNSHVLESKSNFAFLQQRIPSCRGLTTFVAQSGTEVREWALRRWNQAPTDQDPMGTVPPTSDWWVVKASAGNGGRDIWLVHAGNHNSELHSDQLPETQEYVIQKYVHHPMLFRGKKFHFRCYSLMIGDRGVAWFSRWAFILTAGLDYAEDETETKRHITNLSVNKHLPGHPGQLPCLLPEQYPQHYPLMQQTWLETVQAALPFMQQQADPQRERCLDFEFCGLDFVVASDTNHCHLLEINRLPGLESSKINPVAENEMYDNMMLDVLRLCYVGPLKGESSLPNVGDNVGCWDCVSGETAAPESSSGSEGQSPLLLNLLRWKTFTRQQRKHVLAPFH